MQKSQGQERVGITANLWGCLNGEGWEMIWSAEQVRKESLNTVMEHALYPKITGNH